MFQGIEIDPDGILSTVQIAQQIGMEPHKQIAVESIDREVCEVALAVEIGANMLLYGVVFIVGRSAAIEPHLAEHGGVVAGKKFKQSGFLVVRFWNRRPLHTGGIGAKNKSGSLVHNGIKFSVARQCAANEITTTTPKKPNFSQKIPPRAAECRLPEGATTCQQECDNKAHQPCLTHLPYPTY